MKDWKKWLAIAVVAYLIFKNPAGSANFVNEVAHAVATFVAKI